MSSAEKITGLVAEPAELESPHVRRALRRARLEADKAERAAQRRREELEREERWRAACRELAVPHAAKALELLQGYIVGGDGDVQKLGLAQREVEAAMRTATQPRQPAGG